MDKMPKMKLDKLPVWAKNHIELLYANIEYYEKQKNALFDLPPSDTQVTLTYFYGATSKDKDNQPLPRNQTVRFRPDPKADQYVDVGIDHERKAVTVHGGGSGLGLLTIEPQTGNIVAVKFRDR